jgi:hypothetical protein
MSRDPSWTPEQGSGSLGPTIDTDSFAKVLDRYQSGARSIQTSFQALYRQMQDSPQGNSSLVTEKMISNVEQRLAQLDADRQELNAQLLRFASLSEMSSLLTPTRASRSKSRPSRTSFSTFSENDPHDDLLTQIKAENAQLRDQLSAQVNLSRRLRRGLSTVVGFVARRCASLDGYFCAAVQKESDRLAMAIKKFHSIPAKRETRLSKHLAEQKTVVSSLFNSFHSDLSRARYLCVEAIQKQRDSPVKHNSGSFDALFVSPLSTRGNFTYGGRSPVIERPQVIDRAVSLLANACDQLASSILRQFGDAEVWPPAIELVQSPLDFGKQLERLCALNETGVRELRTENGALKAKVAAVQSTISPDVSQMVHKILGAISGLSDEMGTQYHELLARLE